MSLNTGNMLQRLILALVAFVSTNSLLKYAASLLIFSAGLSGLPAAGVSSLPAICAIGVTWWIWVGYRSNHTHNTSAESGEIGVLDRISRRQLLIFFLVLVTVFGGCTSWPLPPSLSKEQREILKSTHIGGTVGVYRASFANQSDETMEMAIREIRGTGLFDRVDQIELFDKEPTYRMEFRGMHWCSDTVPNGWLLLSLGIIPATEGACGGISLRLSRGQGQRYVELNSWFKEKAIHGWVAILFNLSPDRTSGLGLPETSGHQRFIDRLAWIIASKKSEIDNLP